MSIFVFTLKLVIKLIYLRYFYFSTAQCSRLLVDTRGRVRFSPPTIPTTGLAVNRADDLPAVVCLRDGHLTAVIRLHIALSVQPSTAHIRLGLEKNRLIKIVKKKICLYIQL